MLAHKRMFASAIAASLLLVISGCATMFTPGMQDVPVASTPEGAEVFIDGEFVGITPVTVTLIANENHEVVLRLGGEESVWTLQSQIGTSGELGIAGDFLIAVPLVLGGVVLVSAGAQTNCSGCWDFTPPELVPLGIGIVAVGLVPIIVDASTNAFYELVPKEIVADFE